MNQALRRWRRMANATTPMRRAACALGLQGDFAGLFAPNAVHSINDLERIERAHKRQRATQAARMKKLDVLFRGWGQSWALGTLADFRQPSIDCVTVLRIVRVFTRDERDVLKAYPRCIFNVVFNNQDDHAKNFAFRMGEDMAWHISPAYDLTFAHRPGGQRQTSISGAGVPAYADLLRLADEGGVRRQEALAMIDHACQQTVALSGALQNAGVRTQTALEIANNVADNVKRCSGPPATAAAAPRGGAKSSKGRATSSAEPRKRAH